MRPSLPTLLPLLALSAFGCDSAAPVAPDLRGQKLSAMMATSEARPFHAEFTGNPNLSPTGDACAFRNNETGSGTATHLGAFAWHVVESVNFCTVPGGVAIVGSFVMTAANGDELAGDGALTGTFAQNGDLLIKGTYRFTGGTGRFVDAAGSGDVQATRPPGMPVSARFNGTITF
jgi:hypothetical protein